MMRSVLTACLFALSVASAAADATPDPGLRIDVPVKLTDAKIVFNMDRADFEGDDPTGLFFMDLMTDKFAADKTKFRIVAIFHGEAGYMLLGDATYNRVRNTATGNLYKGRIDALRAKGVEFEECGEAMALNRWTNADMLPGIKVNSGANYRIVELVQQGFVQIQP